MTLVSKSVNELTALSLDEMSRVIEIAWEDRTPFEVIEKNYGFNECAVIQLMRKQLKAKSFRLWRAHVSGRSTKHSALRSSAVSRGYCTTQYKQ